MALLMMPGKYGVGWRRALTVVGTGVLEQQDGAVAKDAVKAGAEQLACPTNTHGSHLMPRAERGAQAPGHGPPETAAQGPL